MGRDMSAVGRVAETLAERRLFAYAAGLAVVTLPRALASVDVAVGTTGRTAAFGLGLGLMVATYLSELWVKREGESVGERESADSAGRAHANSTRTTALVAAAAAGLAVGLYVALVVDRVTGLLFVGGALLIAQYAFRRRGGRPEATEG